MRRKKLRRNNDNGVKIGLAQEWNSFPGESQIYPFNGAFKTLIRLE